MDGMALTFERLRSTSKVAVSLPVLRAIISVAIAEMPFEPEFYLDTYPDIRQAYESGQITDLKTHFIESRIFRRQIWSNAGFR